MSLHAPDYYSARLSGTKEWQWVPASDPSEAAERLAARQPTSDGPWLIEVQTKPASTTRIVLYSVEWREVWRTQASLVTV